MYGYVYETINLVNNKKYIGKRVKSKFDINYKGSGKILKQAFEKYGWDNFECRMIEECDSKEQLEERERYWIDYYDAITSSDYYNLIPGGTGWNINLGKHLSDGHRKKISESNKGKKMSEESRKKMSISKKGIKHSAESNLKRSINNIGKHNRKHTDEELEKMRGRTFVWINNGVVDKHVSHNKLCEYVGWERGRLPLPIELADKVRKIACGRIWINDTEKSKMIYPEELNNYLEQGWTQGRIYRRKER